MKKLVLAMLLLAGCMQSQQEIHPTVCYKLEMCEVKLNSVAVNESEGWPIYNIFCIYGYDAAGIKNGDVKRFLSEDALRAWALFHPQAKSCDDK